MESICSLPSFHEELFNRAQKNDVLKDTQVDGDFVGAAEVFRENEKFSIDKVNWYNLYEVSFRTHLHIGQKGWITKFHNKRESKTNAQIVEKQTGNVKVEILLTKYQHFLDLEQLERENRPSKINDIKLSCFAFGDNRGLDVVSFVKELTDSIPPSLFQNIKTLNHGVISYFEIGFLNYGFIVFDPFINLASNWRKAKPIEGAVLIESR